MIRLVRLASASPEERDRILRRPALDLADVLPAVREIMERVRTGGDAALRDCTARFDGVRLESQVAAPAEFDRAEREVPAPVREALRRAADRIAAYHREQVPKPFEFEAVPGVAVGRVNVPFGTAGVYIPGGRAVYPSSLLMGCIPAAVAGVKRIVVCTPPRKDGSLPPEVLVAARIAGVERVVKAGGAQAVAALAYGTADVPKADLIVGPGNRYVTAAKKIVRESGAAAIDFLAGPTEILILSDGTGRPGFLAADLAAQAEHDADAAAVLVTTDEAQATAVAAELGRQVPSCSRAETIGQALRRNGAAVVCRTMDEAVAFSNDYAPEHLLIATRDPRATLREIRNAGSVFLGEYASVPLGDYGSGPNAILPTLGEARFHPGLSTAHFVRPLAYQAVDARGLAALADDTVLLATIEGLDAHAKAVGIRESAETAERRAETAETRERPTGPGTERRAGDRKPDETPEAAEDSIGNWT